MEYRITKNIIKGTRVFLTVADHDNIGCAPILAVQRMDDELLQQEGTARW